MCKMPQTQVPSPFAPTPRSGQICSAIVLAYLLLMAGGIALLRTPAAMPAGSELSPPRSVFTVCNAASLTGFQQTVTIDSYLLFGQLIIFVMMLAGSMVSMIVGSAAVIRLVRLPFSLMQIVLWTVGAHLLAVAVGAAGMIGGGRDAFQALFQAASAFGNCGVVIGVTSSLRDMTFHLLILPLAVMGGLGLPVLMELFEWLRVGRPTSTHTRIVLAVTATVYVLGFIILLTLLMAHEPAPVSENVLTSSTATLNSRTLGWPVASPATWPRAAVWFVMILMIVGASPAGSGGGAKTTTLYVVARGTWSILRGRAVSRIFGIAMVWIAAYLVLVLLSLMFLLSTQPHLPADQLLFISISAVSNVGLSHAPVSITGEGLFGLSVSMMLGRLLPLCVLWWAALTVKDAEVAVG